MRLFTLVALLLWTAVTLSQVSAQSGGSGTVKEPCCTGGGGGGGSGGGNSGGSGSRTGPSK